MARNERPVERNDPRPAAYQAGMELARTMGNRQVAQPFDGPFFTQGRKTRGQRTKRSIHYINDHEYIVTEEVEYFEEDFFSNNNRNR